MKYFTNRVKPMFSALSKLATDLLIPLPDTTHYQLIRIIRRASLGINQLLKSQL